jgi:hypothetical protein
MKSQHTQITRDNYEVWFIDYLDGRLSTSENAMLQKFLSENADLAIELESLEDITLAEPANTGFPNKALLKKASAPFSDLNEYDYQMVKALEQGMPEPENINMASTLALTDWHLYQKIRLQAAVLNYPHKNKLKHKRIAFMPAALRTVAAAILLLVLFNVKDDMPEQYLENNSLVAVTETTPVIEHTPEPNLEEPFTLVTPESITIPNHLVTAANKTAEVTVIETAQHAKEETLTTLPIPKADILPTPNLPNSYETGLRLMLPKYVENHQLMASLSDQPIPRMAEPDTKTLLSRTTDLIKQVTPFNLTYNKVYDKDGELVAVNLSGDNFEVAQKVPKWWGAK